MMVRSIWKLVYVASLKATDAVKLAGMVARAASFVPQRSVLRGLQRVRTHAAGRLPLLAVENLAYKHWSTTQMPCNQRVQAAYDAAFKRPMAARQDDIPCGDSLLDRYGWRRSF